MIGPPFENHSDLMAFSDFFFYIYIYIYIYIYNVSFKVFRGFSDNFMDVDYPASSGRMTHHLKYVTSSFLIKIL